MKLSKTNPALWFLSASLFLAPSTQVFYGGGDGCTGPDGQANIPCGFQNYQFSGNNQTCGVDPSDDSLFEVVYEVCPCYGDFYYGVSLIATGLNSEVSTLFTYTSTVGHGNTGILYTITQPVDFPNTYFLPGSKATVVFDYNFPSSDVFNTNFFTATPMTSIFYSTPTSTVFVTSTITDSATSTSTETSTQTLPPATASTPCITGVSTIMITQPPTTTTVTGDPIIQTSISVVPSISTYTSFGACPTTNSTSTYFQRREILEKRQSTVEVTITPFEQLFCSPTDGTAPSPTTYVTSTATTTETSTITTTLVDEETTTITTTVLSIPGTVTICQDIESFTTGTVPGSQISVTIFPTSVTILTSTSISTTTLLLPPTGCPVPTVYVTTTQTVCPASSTKLVTVTASTCTVPTQGVF